jgi:hypothetical protein
MKELQTQFIDSKGEPVIIGNDKVTQIDVIPLKKGVLSVKFETKPLSNPVGIALKSNKGFIKLSDGRKEKLVYVWNISELPNEVKHEVFSPDNQIKIWNIYQITAGNPLRAEYWTNNAGMVVEVINDHERVYNCSDGIGAFDKTELKVRLNWFFE